MIKKINLLLTILFVSTLSGLFAQTNSNSIIKKTVTETKSNTSYPIAGSHLLREKEQQIKQNIINLGDKYTLPLAKPNDWGFVVGSTQEWWADELTDEGEQYKVPSTCYAVGTNCYIFVEDAVWSTNRVDQTAVDEIAAAFDSNIYPTDTATFGDPPNVDNDEKIIILILDIQDGWSGSGGYVAGYFYSANEYPDGDSYLGGIRSNYAEIFYMDCNPADLITDRTGVLNTTAHEFQHMIHFAYGDDMTFINEGLSEVASYICGYGLRSNGLYAINTNRNLLSWDYDDTLPDYSRAALWTLYLYEQFPNSSLIKDIVIDDVGTWADLDQILRNIDANRDFFTVYIEWLIANYTNGYSNDSRYQYQHSSIAQSVPVNTYLGNPNGQETDREVEALGAEYIKFEGGTDLSIIFTGDATIRVYALKLGSLDMEEVNLGTLYTPQNYSNYSEVTFLVLNKTIGNPAKYSYTATGGAVAQTIELLFEDGIPEGYLKFETGDSSAVMFDGITDGILDSVRIAFRRNGRMMVDISEVGSGISFRGDLKYGPILITVPDSTSSTDPYPNPYDNWYTIDLSQLTRPINATDDFIVSCAIGNNPAEPGIMVSKEPDQNFNKSRTYVVTDNQWYNYGYDDDDDNSLDGYWSYLIRAYVRIGDATVAIDPNGIVLIPDEFSLGDNYPNPFNPTTTFNFATPKDGLVNFTVHDLLGREIYSEHRNLLAGSYAFTWNGQNDLDQQVVSGVYFLKMEADGFAQTRKMLMMK